MKKARVVSILFLVALVAVGAIAEAQQTGKCGERQIRRL